MPSRPVVRRLAQAVLDGDVPLDEGSVRAAVRDRLPELAPLASAGTDQAVVDEVLGLGPLERFLREGAVTDVLVNGTDVWVERSGRLTFEGALFDGADEVVAAVERVIAPVGERLDRSAPTVDVRLADGSRLHAVAPPIAVDGPIVAIRRFTSTVADLDGLVEREGCTEAQADRLREAVAARRNIIVCGGTGAGKTTVLNVLSREIPAEERTVVVEDATELQLAGHVVRLAARRANADGFGEVTLHDLVRSALRLRPDRLVVGEVRGSEALDLVGALNTGHDGSLATIHANGPDEALWRLETLALSGPRRVRPSTVRRQIEAALDVVVHVERRGGHRSVAAIAEVGR